MTAVASFHTDPVKRVLQVNYSRLYNPDFHMKLSGFILAANLVNTVLDIRSGHCFINKSVFVLESSWVVTSCAALMFFKDKKITFSPKEEQENQLFCYFLETTGTVSYPKRFLETTGTVSRPKKEDRKKIFLTNCFHFEDNLFHCAKFTLDQDSVQLESSQVLKYQNTHNKISSRFSTPEYGIYTLISIGLAITAGLTSTLHTFNRTGCFSPSVNALFNKLLYTSPIFVILKTIHQEYSLRDSHSYRQFKYPVEISALIERINFNQTKNGNSFFEHGVKQFALPFKEILNKKTPEERKNTSLSFNLFTTQDRWHPSFRTIPYTDASELTQEVSALLEENNREKGLSFGGSSTEVGRLCAISDGY